MATSWRHPEILGFTRRREELSRSLDWRRRVVVVSGVDEQDGAGRDRPDRVERPRAGDVRGDERVHRGDAIGRQRNAKGAERKERQP